MRTLSIFLLLVGTHSFADLPITIEPVGLDEKSSQALTRLALDLPQVKQRLRGSHYTVLRASFDGMAQDEFDKGRVGVNRRGDFTIDLYDYTRDRLVTAKGNLEERGVALSESEDQPAPTPDEIQQAIALVQQDSFFAPGAIEGWRGDHSMPPVIDMGTREREIAIAVHPTAGSSYEHEIVGVNLSRRQVIRFPEKAPPTTIARAMVCAPESAGQGGTARWTAGKAVLTVGEAASPTWKMTVIRPSASAGRWGSAIEIRDVMFKGKRVFSQAHVPVLSVLYDNNVCGPFRDWQYEESPFEARGSLLASGIMNASAPPKTIFESGKDAGNFRGVAIYRSGSRTILVTELASAWYRYKNEWIFHDDGTIEPKWGFSAVQASCTCNNHHHHSYWRMDFDIGPGTSNQVQYHDGNAWQTLTAEAKHIRDSTHTRWRVIDPATGSGYEVIPGSGDGNTDKFGKGDFWALKYARGQTDDSSVYSGAAINIDRFINNQSVKDTDVVVWYASHFMHHIDGAPTRHAIMGPTLKPVNW